jgi:hypothetical protein
LTVGHQFQGDEGPLFAEFLFHRLELEP